MHRWHHIQQRALPSIRTRHASMQSSSKKRVTLRSKLWMPTLKKAPNAEASIASHQLLLRGGFIRKNNSPGLFSFLPMGTRVLNKLQAIIEDEMDAVDGQKLDLPLLIPKELWEVSGRWDSKTSELMRMKDRHESEFTLAPTHEESITDLVANNYTLSTSSIDRANPPSLRLYQIGRKFRDEIRPRFGLLRAREFIMKDMYAFDVSSEAALTTYHDVAAAYHRILEDRLQLDGHIAKVDADSGEIGGNLSQEFHVLSDVGEDALLLCDNNDCKYAANVEKAISCSDTSFVSKDEASLLADLMEGRSTADTIVSEIIRNHHKVKAHVVHVSDSKSDSAYSIIVLTAPDMDLNPIFMTSFCSDELQLADASIRSIKSLSPDNSAPSGWKAVCIDTSLISPDTDSSRAKDNHVHIGTFRSAQEGDTCAHCNEGKLHAKRGIEVGHVFYLGTKYSTPFQASFDENIPFEMGCYGMGLTRLLAGIVEASHDKFGVVWPMAIAPFHVCVLSTNAAFADDTMQLSEELRSQLNADVLLDDRWQERAGVKLADSELSGVPFRVVVGKKFGEDRQVEVLRRRDMTKSFVKVEEVCDHLAMWIKEESNR